MAQAIPYLAFDGTCAAAMRHYADVLGLGAALEMMLSGADMPTAPDMPPGHEDRIIHARIRFGDGSCIYVSDTPAHMAYNGIKGVAITMNYPTAAEAKQVFDTLSEGGRVTMPFEPAFWAKGVDMLTDRFGTPWSINGEVTI